MSNSKLDEAMEAPVPGLQLNHNEVVLEDLLPGLNVRNHNEVVLEDLLPGLNVRNHNEVVL